MADSPLTKRLGIKPGQRVLVLDAPDSYWQRLGKIPEGVELSTRPEGEFDVVQAFVTRKADADRLWSIAYAALRTGGMLWFAYPKKTSKVQTDITRDAGWDAAWAQGWTAIATVSIDETWSGIRFRPASDVKRRAT